MPGLAADGSVSWPHRPAIHAYCCGISPYFPVIRRDLPCFPVATHLVRRSVFSVNSPAYSYVTQLLLTLSEQIGRLVMTNRRIRAVAVAATAGGGLLTAAFLQTAVAVAAPGEDAFTIDGTTFDPITASGDQGFDLVGPLSLAPPLLGLGGGKALGVLNLAPQAFDLYDGTTELGSIDTNETVAYLFGLPTTAFTVLDSTPADGVDASQLPPTGTVYDVLNLGGGFYNVYVATPDAGDTDGTVTDTLVTPFGNMDLSAMFADMNAANPLDPGNAFTALQAGDSGLGDDAFSIGGFTFDPFSVSDDGTTIEGFTPVDSLASIPPLLNLGGGQLTLSTSYPESQPTPFAPQDFDVYSGTGSDIGRETSREI